MSTVVAESPDAEVAVLGRLLAEPDKIGEVVASLTPEHFHTAANRVLYAAVVEAFYADDPVDALTIGELNAKRLTRLWGGSERDAVHRVEQMASTASTGPVAAHADVVKRQAEYRKLVSVMEEGRRAVEEGELSPEEIGGALAEAAAKVATSTLSDKDFTNFGDAGRELIHDQAAAKAAREKQLELGVYCDIDAIDRFTHGIRPGELMIAAGEPGVGKTSTWLRAALNFAIRQAKRPADQQVGTLILSLEMTSRPSNIRFGSMLTGINGSKLREGLLTEVETVRLINNWRQHQHVPLYLNYSSSIRASQLRALVSEGVRRHNTGLILIDHFGMWHLDERSRNPFDEDERKALYLKTLANDHDCAIVCIAHSRKMDERSNGRPRLGDLRGSGQIAAHADYVNFIYRPWLYASDEERNSGEVKNTTAEMIWAKNRHGMTGRPEFHFNPETMLIA